MLEIKLVDDEAGKDASIIVYNMRQLNENTFVGVVYNSLNAWILEPAGKLEIRAVNEDSLIFSIQHMTSAMLLRVPV